MMFRNAKDDRQRTRGERILGDGNAQAGTRHATGAFRFFLIASTGAALAATFADAWHLWTVAAVVAVLWERRITGGGQWQGDENRASRLTAINSAL